MKYSRLSSLDSLRGISAVGVAFFWHYQHFAPQHGFPFSKKAFWLYNYGFSLVDFFFILSGFIFSYIYKNSILNCTISFRNYAINRFSRLYPLHVLTLLLVAIIQFIRTLFGETFFVYSYNDIYHFFLNLLFIQSGWFEKGYSFNAPSWSISSEIIAYYIFFMILYFITEKRQIFVFLGIVLLGLTILKLKISYPLFNSNIARVLAGFFLGCILFEIDKLIKLAKNKYLIVNLLSIIFLYIVAAAIMYGNEIFGVNWQIIYTMIIFPVIILLVLNIKILNLILSFKPLTYLGSISFSIYLLHFPIQLLIKTLDETLNWNLDYSSRVFFFIFFLITITMSALSFECFEKPVQKIIRTNYS